MKIRLPRMFAGPWPDSNALATKLFLGLIVVAVLCGPIALGFAATRQHAAPDTAAQDHGPQEEASSATTSDEARAGVEAAAFVEVWLTATREQAAQVAAMLLDPPEDLQLPAKPSGRVAADAITADPVPATGRWVITVRSRHTDGARWWLVEVLVDGDKAAITALPSQIPAPPNPDRDARPDLEQLPATHPAADTASEFLTAMLTGDGDITRWSSPGSALAAIAPAPCVEVAVAVSAAAAAADIPDTGQELDLSVDVTCHASDDSTRLAQYGLHLRGRDGRWEVANVTTPAHTQTR